MKRMRLFFYLASFCLFTISMSSRAFAQCGALPKHVSYPLLRGSGVGKLQLAVATQDGIGDEGRGDYGLEPIVGLWKLDFEDPADGYSDKGYSIWHSDHTEYMNSTRPPSVGAVCQGVWERVDRYTYKLNHFALGYMDGVNLTSVYRFQETVHVNRSGNKFKGEFIIEAFDPKTHGHQGTYQGTVTGEKVTIDTTIDSQDF